jgi:transcriptional antiterminator NusG
MMTEEEQDKQLAEAVPEASVPPAEEVVEAVQPAVAPESPVEPAAAFEAGVDAEIAAKTELPPPVGEKRWYVIQTFTGQEDRVKQAIEQTIALSGLKDRVFQVLVPTEDTVEIKAGKRVEKIRKMFPGYVFLEMILDEISWYEIRQTAGVARFIGTKVSPTPVSDREMQRVLKQLGKEERLEITFEKGEGVRVISGPFRGYTGTVDEVNAEKGKLKVLINIFGRDTPVEVNFEHAQKIV